MTLISIFHLLQISHGVIKEGKLFDAVAKCAASHGPQDENVVISQIVNYQLQNVAARRDRVGSFVFANSFAMLWSESVTNK